MTREETAKALDMAIEALSAEYEDYEHATLVDIKEPLKVSVVRCKDCKQRRVEGDCTHYYYCDFMGSMCGDNEYCSFGERRAR